MCAKKKSKPLSPDAKALFLLASGFLLLIALGTFSVGAPKANWLGYAGYGAAFFLTFLFGIAAYLVPLSLFFVGARLLRMPPQTPTPLDLLSLLLLLLSSSLLLSVYAETFPSLASAFSDHVLTQSARLYTPYPQTAIRYNLGGVPFHYLYRDLPFASLHHLLSPIGTTLLFSSLSFVSLLLLTRVQIVPLLKRLPTLFPPPAAKPTPKPPSYPTLPRPKPKEEDLTPPLPKKKLTEILKSPPPSVPAPKPKEKPVEKDPEPLPKPPSSGSFRLPPATLLVSPSPKVDQPTLKKDLKRQASVLEETLRSFGIDGKVGEIHCGPSITSFEVHPPIGVKVQKIKALENDIALNMQAKSIRIVAPIPGKAAVGVEIPALHPQEVNFRELLTQYQNKSKRLSIPLLLGKGISGEPLFGDLTRMPHLLIAGATGSGKSVCIHSILLSMLMNLPPSDLRLLMIDPKKVELTQYSRLPHMISPVITEPHGAYAALSWLVREMQNRYELLKQLGLRNIAAYNSRKPNAALEASLPTTPPATLPFIVAIIDEFADLMMASSADIETPIARIAQMARAVGIHLILATQRPSREVITGIIKANIPSRIAFKVASRINSQIILDEIGAESLLGSGDLLFLPPGTSTLARAQGAYVSDDEINHVVEYITSQLPTSYLIPSFDNYQAESLPTSTGQDALYDQALQIILSTKLASTTFLQRKLKIGYARAASLMDELETNGVVGPQEGSRPRRVLSNSTPDLPLSDEEFS